MGAFNAKGLTNKGIALQAKAQAGAQLLYTKFMIGDGTLGTSPVGPLTKLISPKLTLPITGKEPNPPDRATLLMVVDNQNVETGFYWRELGLYAQDPDEGEILYWYGNAGATADFIPAGGGSDIFQEQFALHVFVGTATNVTAVIDTSLIYATVDQVNDAVDEMKSYTDGAVTGATIPDASLTQKGKVQLINTFTSISETLVPNAKALRDGVIDAKTAAATDATTKVTDHNNLTTGIHGAVSTATANRLIIRDASGRAQIAAPSAAADIARLDTVTGQVGALSSLLTTAKGSAVAAINELFQSGVSAKQGVVDAINAKGGSASTNDTWATLATKINAIQTTPTATDLNVVRSNITLAEGATVYYDIATIPALSRIVLFSTNPKITGTDQSTIYAYGGWRTSVMLRDAAGNVHDTGLNISNGFTSAILSLFIDRNARSSTIQTVAPDTGTGSNITRAFATTFDLSGNLRISIQVTRDSGSTDVRANYAFRGKLVHG